MIALVLIAAGCARTEQPKTAHATASTLTRRLEMDVSTLNPVAASSLGDRLVANYLFTPLVRLNQNLEVIPGLAESWTISDDGRTYTFKLNPKATFSNGLPVRASDVLYTIEKIVDPNTHAGNNSSFEFFDRARSAVLDATTVRVAFTRPLAAQPLQFADVWIVPEAVYAKRRFVEDFAATAVGSGPYKLVRRDVGKAIVLEKRADYWDAPVHIDRVVFKVIGDRETAWQALKRGEIDETIVTPDQWQRERQAVASTVNFQQFYTLSYNFIAWNNRHPILRDRNVRMALSMCIPREEIVAKISHGAARPMTGPFTPDEWAFNPDVQPVRFDPAGAKQLLAKAGWSDKNGDGVLDRNGKPLSIELLVMPGATMATFAQIVQAEMKRAGVDLSIRILDPATAIDRVRHGNFEAAYLGFDLDADPDPFALFHSSQVPPNGKNFVFYSNPEADRLMDEARTCMVPARRRELYRQLHVILAADQPYAWIVQTASRWGVSRRISNAKIGRGYGLFLWYPGELAWTTH